MKKVLFLSIALLIITGLSACSSKKEETPQSAVIQNKESQATAFLASYTKSDWLNELDEVNWEDIKEEEDGFSYQFKEDVDQTRKNLQYKKNNNGDYEGVLKIKLENSNESHTINIPKSFASHIDKLDFSIEPSKIINPDPIVEFTGTNEEIEIKSLETKTESEVRNSLEKQIIDTETKRCEKLKDNKAVSCLLSLISKYRDSKYIQDELKDLNMAEFLGGATQAVLNSNLKTCDYINKSDERTLCYEYAYQTLIKDCDGKNGKNYRTCVRDLSGKLPSFKEQRLFCGYIKNEEMRAECQGTAPLTVCNEIDDGEQKNLCKINIVRTNNDIKACADFDDNTYKQACVAIVGVGLNNANTCDQVEDEYLSGLCKTKIAINNNDKDVCNGIKDLSAKDLCLGNFLTKEEYINKRLCDSFNELFLKESCELVLAVISNAPGKCADTSIVSLENQPICYMGIAMKHNNPEMCEKIQAYNDYDREAVEKLKESCLKIGNTSSTEQNNQPADKQAKTDKEKLAEYPGVPDWMDCPTVEGSVLKNIGGGQTSGFYYYSPETRGNVGLEMRWWGPNFDQPYNFICRNAEGDKDGPFKTWNQDGSPSSEGAYKNGKLHGEIKSYSNNTLRLLETYENGILNGNHEKYCVKNDKNCNAGDIIKSGTYVDGKKNGFWSTYKFGEFEFKEEYIDNEVTRDENGRNIKYY